MKKKSLILILALFLGAFGSSAQSSENLDGIWKMTYKKWELSDTTIEQDEFEFPAYKIFFNDQFSLSGVDEEGKFVGHFGSFRFDGDIYSEKITFSSYEYLIGRKVKFKSRITGNQWIIQGDIGTKDMKFELLEIWERVE